MLSGNGVCSCFLTRIFISSKVAFTMFFRNLELTTNIHIEIHKYTFFCFFWFHFICFIDFFNASKLSCAFCFYDYLLFFLLLFYKLVNIFPFNTNFSFFGFIDTNKFSFPLISFVEDLWKLIGRFTSSRLGASKILFARI